VKASRVTVAEPGSWTVEDAVVSSPGAGEVLLELDSAGICGGDLSLVRGKNAVASYPTGLGHECAATVLDVGPGVTLARGDQVVVYPTIGCQRCPACRDGRFNNCPDVKVLGLTDPRGCFSTRFVLPEELCIPVPSEVFERFGALIEPVAVAQHVLGRVGGAADARVLIIGSGSIGLALALVARATGAAHITAVDVNVDRAPLADLAGVDTFLVSSEHGHHDRDGLPVQVGEHDIALDVVCRPETLALCQRVVVPGGTIGLVAAAKPRQVLALDYERAYSAEQRIVASRNYVKADFQAAIELLATGTVDATVLRTRVVPLERFDDAVDALEDPASGNLKVLLTRSEIVGSRPLLRDPVR
jgi:L-iditol 2-dehydrogenase/L-gulonate 5-dehydrogenase